MKNKKKTKSFWTSLHGILTGCAASITIIIGLMTIYKTGILKKIPKPPSTPPYITQSPATGSTHLPSVTKQDNVIAEEKKPSELKFLVNRDIKSYPNKSNVALIIDSVKTKSGFSPESTLYDLFRADEINIIVNFFKEEEFKSKGFFKKIYDGNTELLKQADVFSKIDYIILGKVNYSFRKGAIDSDLVSCDINFSYKIINKNAEIIRSDNISVVGPGFSNDAALERGLEILHEKYPDRILKLVL